MMNRMAILLLTVCVVFMSGCSQYWYQEGMTYDQCLQDRQECFKELEKRTSFTYTSRYEFEYMTQCMQEKGYRLIRENELPMDIKRSEPQTTLHWRAKGIAGTLE